MANNPLVWVDPLGLRKQGKEFELTIGPGGEVGYVIVGGGVLDVIIKDVQTGQTTIYPVAVFGVGVGLPQVNITSKPIKFSVSDPSVTSADFGGYGYLGGGSFVIGVGITIGGGIKIPNGPFIPGNNIDVNYGGVRIGVSHSVTYFYEGVTIKNRSE